MTHALPCCQQRRIVAILAGQDGVQLCDGREVFTRLRLYYLGVTDLLGLRAFGYSSPR
jgi:hypothetical protein